MRRAWMLVLALIPSPAAARLAPECKTALAQADALARRGDGPAAQAALDAALAASGDPAEGGECTARALGRMGELARASGDDRAAARHFRRAAHRALGDHALWRSLTEARVALEKKLGHPKTVARLVELLAADRLLSAVDRAPRSGAPAAKRAALEEAAALLAKDKDPVRAAFAAAVRAKALAASGDRAAAVALAEPLSMEGPRRPLFVRLAAQEALALAATDAEAQARAALLVDFLRAEAAGRALDERRFARSPAVEKACARYEKSAGEGLCARLARSVTGHYSFTDFSRGKPRRTVTRDQIERAQAQYSFAVEGCVREAAEANSSGELFENATLKIGWSVRPDGRASDVEIAPKRYEPLLGACVRERVAWFRYPRATDGQVHTISIPYALEVTEKFGGSRR